jgi:hypothetical protein
MLFDITNNSNHASLKVTNPIEAIVTPLPNHVDVMAGELITLAQVLVKEMVISLECDGDENDEDTNFWSHNLEGGFFFLGTL